MDRGLLKEVLTVHIKAELNAEVFGERLCSQGEGK